MSALCSWFAEYTDGTESNGSSAKWIVGGVVRQRREPYSSRDSGAPAPTCPAMHCGIRAMCMRGRERERERVREEDLGIRLQT